MTTNTTDKPKPLSNVKAGQKVRVVSIDAGRGLAGRLLAMGIIPNSEIAMLTESSSGPVVIEVKGSKVMLGRGMAQKIIVV